MLCVIAKLDEAARERLLNVQKIVTEFGLLRRALYGHITLATFIQGEEAQRIGKCKAALKEAAPVRVRFKEIAEFTETSVVAAIPEKTEALAALQRRAVGDGERLLDRWTRCAAWQPHTTLVHQPGMELAQVCAAMQSAFEPFETWVERIEFSRVEDGRCEVVDGLDLHR